MEQVSSPKNSNLRHFAEFLEGGDGTDLRSPSMNVDEDGGREQDSDFLGDQLQHSRPSVGSKQGQNG